MVPIVRLMLRALRMAPLVLAGIGVSLGGAVGKEKEKPSSVCEGPHARWGYWGGDGAAEAEARPAFERFMCGLYAVPRAPAPELVPTGASVDLGWKAPGGALKPLVKPNWRELATTVELVDTVNFKTPPKIDFSAFGNLAQPASLVVGEQVVWLVTPGGARVYDGKRRLWSFTPPLHAGEVRPRDVAVDEAAGSAWFFGRELFRYDLAEHRVYRIKPAKRSFRVIRKVAPAAGGLWLATDGGPFWYDARRQVLLQLHDDESPVAAPQSQVAAFADSAWFAGGDGRLLKVIGGDPPRAAFGPPTGKLPPIELVARQDGLWFLASQDHGRSFQLATVDREGRLSHSGLTLFNLRESEGVLVGAAHDLLYRIDPASRSATTIAADIVSIGGLALGKRVLFTGASYVNSRSTDAVGRYVLDLSKGWQTPGRRLAFEGWGPQQSREMFEYAPPLLETAGNRREIWFLIAGNPDNPLFDRSFAVRYDRLNSQAEVFFSRWTGAGGVEAASRVTQPFVVERLATSVKSME